MNTMKFVILLFFIAFAIIILFLTRLCQKLSEYASSKISFDERYWLAYDLKCANIVAIVGVILGILYVCIP